MATPQISIITVTYNAEAVLIPTIESVINQSYKKIEYIIIDGASKDDTMSIVKNYESKIDYVISEPDKGLYDAMNKGIKVAKGEFLLFLNAGDTLYKNDTIANIFMSDRSNADVYYGETMLIDTKGKSLGKRSEITRRILPKAMTWKDMKYGMVVCHQSFIARKNIVSLYIDNNLCADIDWVIKCLKATNKIVNTNQIISNFLIGGVSKQQQKKALKDRYTVYQKHFGFLHNLWIHLVITWRAFVFSLKKQEQKL